MRITRRFMAAVLAVLPFARRSAAGEATDRKARSMLHLKSEGVPIIEHLPMIETEAESTRRPTEDVIRRTIALTIVAVKGETADQNLARNMIAEWRADRYFTQKEQAFIDNPSFSDRERVQFSWRYECVNVLLWALSVFPTLARPEKICDVPLIARTLRELGPGGLRLKAVLRPQRELLDATDLTYRYHWAMRDAQVNGKDEPAGLSGDVVMERHYALNWLIGYQDQAWDDVSTDT